MSGQTPNICKRLRTAFLFHHCSGNQTFCLVPFLLTASCALRQPVQHLLCPGSASSVSFAVFFVWHVFFLYRISLSTLCHIVLHHPVPRNKLRNLSFASAIYLEWTPPVMNGGTPVGYELFRNDGSGTEMESEECMASDCSSGVCQLQSIRIVPGRLKPS